MASMVTSNRPPVTRGDSPSARGWLASASVGVVLAAVLKIRRETLVVPLRPALPVGR